MSRLDLVYAASRAEAQRLLDESYLEKFVAVPEAELRELHRALAAAQSYGRSRESWAWAKWRRAVRREWAFRRGTTATAPKRSPQEVDSPVVPLSHPEEQ